jgi:hypothetical protein
MVCSFGWRAFVPTFFRNSKGFMQRWRRRRE